MNLKCELKKTSRRKSVSNDQIYQLVFETDDPSCMDLGKLQSETIFLLNIEIEK